MITAVSCALSPVSTQLSSHTLGIRSGERTVDTISNRKKPPGFQLLDVTRGTWTRDVGFGTEARTRRRGSGEGKVGKR